jgi:glucose-6-phosphate 1-epimerase
MSNAARFARPGVVRVDSGPGGLERVTVTTPACRVSFLLHGAHVTDWEPAGQAPVVWMTGHARFAPGEPVRGGVPLCWPWFGPASDATVPLHGVVRTLRWELADLTIAEDGTLRAELHCQATPQTLALFPHSFALRYVITAGTTLDLALHASNTGSHDFRVSEALHTYLAVGDIRRVHLTGLEGTTYLDRSEELGHHLILPHPRGWQEDAVRFSAELDRHHLDHHGSVTVHDPLWHRRIHVAKRGSHSTQVWNPWPAKAVRLADLGNHEWPGFVAVEAANAFDHSYVLPAGASHELATTIAVEAL